MKVKEKSAISTKNEVAVAALLPSPSFCRMSGPQFLLCSIAGATAAAGITVGRWLIVETGEVLLLFHSEHSDKVCRNNDYDDHHHIDAKVEGIDSDFSAGYSFQCADDDKNIAGDKIGEALLTIASSPYLRSVPLVLLFISSTALVVGAILTQKQIRHCWTWIQTCQEYGELCSQQIMTAMGVSNQNELTTRLKDKHCQLKSMIWEHAQRSMECMDGLVLDDILHKYIKAGVEFSMGVGGGIFLYSLPDDIFEGSVNGAKGTRRRLIRAVDPSLANTIFRPGGVWDIIPPHLINSLKGLTLTEKMDSNLSLFNNVACEVEAGSAPVGGFEQQIDDDTNDNDEDSSDTPLASPVPTGDLIASNHDNVPVHYALVCAKGGDISIMNHDEGSRETIGDALSGAITELVFSNTKGERKSVIENGQHSDNSDIGGKPETQTKQHEEHENGEPSPLPPNLQLEKVLHRASMAATFLFFCHLRGSPSTRKAWGSAAIFCTSLSLVSTAIGAGVASLVLSSNASAIRALSANPMADLIYSKILEYFRVLPLCVLPAKIKSRIQWMYHLLRSEIQKNKRLQTVLAFIVLYGMRRMSRKGGHIKY